ncbi:MAG TPA: VOC family protein [Bacteroidales bacterium]|nr:VOC family protein [Bacteroidales bacterium]
MKNSIYPCLWFDGNANEAAEFYVSVLKDSEITDQNQFVTLFESSGQRFMCLNGGPEFSFNPSISFSIACETEAEVDQTWKSLVKDGSVLMPLDKYEWSSKYGWLQDRFGVSWQVSLNKMEDAVPKFTPSLLFTGPQSGNAEQAIQFYTSVFDNSGITMISRYTREDNDTEGYIKYSLFKLNDQIFSAMDSSLLHQFGFNPAVSFVVDCETQDEIDYFWNKLSEGGHQDRCGWLQDQFGVSWQVVPSILEKLIKDPERSQRVIDAFMQMKKFEIDKLVSA